jgi:hypothetical protein
MNVHAALNKWVLLCCTKAGVRVFNLTDDSGYFALYKSYTQGRNSGRKNLVPVNFTRDEFVKVGGIGGGGRGVFGSWWSSS